MAFKTTPKEFPKSWIVIYKAHIDKLIEKYPAVFNKEYPLPLELGSHKRIKQEMGWHPQRVHAVLTIWTSRMEYNMMANTVGRRYTLDGEEGSTITKEHSDNFIMKLNTFKNVERIADFCKAYNKTFKKLPLVNVPMNRRPNLSRFF